MLRVHHDDFVPKYRNGKWHWNETEERIEFQARPVSIENKDQYVKTGGFKFANRLNQLEEMIFRQEFQRSSETHDADVILLQDIKNLVMFLAPNEIMTRMFIRFLHTRTVDRFLTALIIYFEHYLHFVEFVLIRRDEISGDMAQMQSNDSNDIKRIYSQQLSQYRLILAREYSEIILGQGEMKPFYHIKPIVNISQSIKDKRFHEAFLAFCMQVVWIAMHRRAYDVIEAELGRLFRSEHFRLTRGDKVQYSRAEASMLYGKNYKRVNYRAQNSPLIQELINVSDVNLPLLWVGNRKYRGTDYRILQLELEYLVPDSQLVLIDVVHGILGHPKKLYNTMLQINWEAVRFENYSKIYDPYHIIRQPCIEVPKLDAEKIRKDAKTFEHYYHIVDRKEPVAKSVLRKWMKRDEVVNYFKTEGIITNLIVRGINESTNEKYGPPVDEIITKFRAQKEKLRKKK